MIGSLMPVASMTTPLWLFPEIRFTRITLLLARYT